MFSLQNGLWSSSGWVRVNVALILAIYHLNLPDDQHIKTIDGLHDIKTPDGKLLGRYTIENGKIKVIVAHLGIQDSAKSGWITFHGTVIKDGENIRIGTKGIRD